MHDGPEKGSSRIAPVLGSHRGARVAPAAAAPLVLSLPRQMEQAQAESLLWTAASLGHLPDVEGLVAAKCALDAPNPRDRDSTPLVAAARNGHFEVVRFLMRKGADLMRVTADGRTAVHAAAAEGCLQVRARARGGCRNCGRPCARASE